MTSATTGAPAYRRAVVTGAAGFIGSHLCEALLDEGWLVTGIDHLRGHPEEVTARNLRSLRADPRFLLVTADIAVADLDSLLYGADTVFHLAARPGVRASWGERFSEYVDSNVLGTHRLLDAAGRGGVRRVVVSSSSSVYGGAEDGPTAETSLPTPLSPYGVTKLLTEQLSLVHAKRPGSRTSVVALRYFTVYGPRQRADMAITRMIDSALTGRPITVFGDGLQRRDFTFVSDAVQANLLAAQARAQAVAVNVGTGSTITVLELIELVGEVVGQPVAFEHGPPGDGDARSTHADLAGAAEVLGYWPTVDLRTGIKHQVEWIRSLSAGAREPQLARG
ncbi:NAD-dependent epimerase/dehydratase family protein [Actinacidiphila oryziradicis]|uniref:NAD-dependent epimerase/dehydratase family protein n=1 Tax=Actinacidiphila oryziradicis TaxID=2571141 RepID=A0A4U0SN77_9ACTN|nr:NAD-dependent epimerase/dehydratase family protein [Actinacidiphila oryziradicis]TKA11206.1 NAD-dependent epimerase/dehydratase family protein [Actinacidiphila oryziradicis]